LIETTVPIAATLQEPQDESVDLSVAEFRAAVQWTQGFERRNGVLNALALAV
jgi:hypothetical protein